MKIKAYFKDLCKVFNKSINELNKKTLGIVIYDLLFYISLFIGVFIIGALLSIIASSKTEIISQLQQGINTLPLDQLQNILINAKWLLFFLILAILLIVIYSIVCLSIFKGLIWKKLLNEKFTKKFFYNFFIVNLIWFIPIVVLLFASIILLASVLQDKYLLMQFVKWPVNIILYLTLYFHVLFTFNLSLTNKIKQSLKNTFYFGIAKFHLLISPIIIILLILYIISKLYSFLPINNSLVNSISYLIILSFYLIPARIFYINSIKEFILKNKKPL